MKATTSVGSKESKIDHTETTKAQLLFDKKDLLREFRRRVRVSEEKTVAAIDEPEAIAAGWIVRKRYKRGRVSVEKLKGYESSLEDRVWCLLFRMGYPVLSRPRFRMAFERHDKTITHRTVQVLAKDDETVLVVECRAREKRGRRSLLRDLSETSACQGDIAETIRRMFGRQFKHKVVWIYVTDNIIWSEADMDRANDANVRVVTENELQYYETFIRHIGAAGRFQFLAEFLRGQKIPQLANVKVPAVKGRVGGEVYYSFVTTPKHLLKIAFVNHLALNHPDGRPAYQRMVSQKRLKKIRSFIERGGFFPTNILINFTEKCRFDLLPNKVSSEESVTFGWLHLPDKYKSAWVIDGQHRLYGFSNLPEKFFDQNLFVLAFERLETKKEAELFITINHEQKSVPRQILVALQADLKWGSDEPKERLGALCSALAKSLNADSTGVLFRRFSIEGTSEDDDQSLTIAEVVKGLEQSKLLGKIVHQHLLPGPLSDATDEKTILRARKVLSGYFEQIFLANQNRWNAGRAGHLCVNPGIRAHLRLIADCLEQARAAGRLEPEEADDSLIVRELTKAVRPFLDWTRSATDAEFAERFARRFGDGGVKEYFFEVCDTIADAVPDFGSADYKQYRKEATDQRRAQADQQIISTTRVVTDYVISVLKLVHGETRMPSGELRYWEIGIDNARAKEAAYKRQLDEPDPERRLHKEAYLDILDIRDVVRQKNNWEHFKDVFNIPMIGEKGKVYYLQWMEEFNKLRRIPAHSSSLRRYSDDDYKFLEWLKKELVPRFRAKGMLV